MNAASKDQLGTAPAAPNLLQDALREKHRRSRGAARGDGPEDAPASEPGGTGEGEPEPGGTPERAPEREPAPAPSRAPGRERARKGERRGAPDAPETVTDDRTGGSEGSRPADAPRGPQDGSQAVVEADGDVSPEEMDEGMAVLWELDQATRSFLAGLRKIAPRKTRLAAAVAAYLEAGGSAADIRSRFAAIGIPGRDIPSEIQEALRRRPAAP